MSLAKIREAVVMPYGVRFKAMFPCPVTSSIFCLSALAMMDIWLHALWTPNLEVSLAAGWLDGY